MAKSTELVSALRETASKLSDGAKYEWGHMGRCNCGHLVQTITNMTDVEIVKSIDFKMDEWSEHAKDYCENTDHQIDEIFETMRGYGFGHEDMVKLEYLSDKKVLDRITTKDQLRHNDVDDVILYLEEMANMLEEETVLV
ncbi:MAG: hypothetical protein AAFX87_22910 [Bacteroidota bacterium]